MLSRGELQSIDDWRFSQRIGSRSDAIRRLCKSALEAAETKAVPS